MSSPEERHKWPRRHHVRRLNVKRSLTAGHSMDGDDDASDIDVDAPGPLLQPETDGKVNQEEEERGER